MIVTGYDTQNDPDCWWSSSGCTVPKLKDVNADIYYCDEPETLGLVSKNCATFRHFVF